MNEMRQNRITGQWVIYAAARQNRPHDNHRREDAPSDLPSYVASCPFCPGNEHLTPPTLLQWPPADAPWQVRAFANKFPILSPEDDTGDFAVNEKSIYLSAAAYGRHEIVVETPHHNEDLSEMAPEQAEAIIEVCHRRYLDMKSDPHIQCVFLFRNHGVRAGASLAHPHSQLIATNIVPSRVSGRESVAHQYYDEQGRCAYCDALDFEISAGQRVVYQNRSFVAFVPYAAEVPFEVWVAPLEHRADFGLTSKGEQADLADALQTVLRRLRQKVNDPDYNCMFYTASKSAEAVPYLHWYVQIRPRIAIEAGFEIASGMSVNMSFPEEDAALLSAT